MIHERLMQILLAPYISEKSTMTAEKHNHVVFKVATDATKKEIKQAVEQLFKVTVMAVRVVNVKGKTKRFRQQLGRRKDWKKAYVTLTEGHDINFIGAE